MISRPHRRKPVLHAVIAAAFFAAAGLAFFQTTGVIETVSSQVRRPRRPAAVRPAPKYSEFAHDVAAHQKDCATCHSFPSPNWKTVRAEKDAFPDITEYPRHESCLDCHRQQFFKGSKPAICSICHVNPSPRDSRRHPFPNPREAFDSTAKGKAASSDFEIRFPHATHIEIVSRHRSSPAVFRNASLSSATQAEASCAVCHKTIQPQGDSSEEFLTKPPPGHGDAFWLKKGTFKSVPTGHSTCFSCHSSESGISPAPTACASCHAPKSKSGAADFDAKLASRTGISDKAALDLWRRRTSSGTYRHEWFSHAELSCATCHNVEKMNTLDQATTRVSISSCATCHATATADEGGALNFEIEARKKNAGFECAKCHITFGKAPIPDSHLKALSAAGAK